MQPKQGDKFNLLYEGLASVCADVGFLKAEQWALNEAMKTAMPDFFVKLEAHRTDVRYHEIRSESLSMLSEIKDALEKG